MMNNEKLMKEHFTLELFPAGAPAQWYVCFVFGLVAVTSAAALLLFLIRRAGKFVAIMPQYLHRKHEG